MNQPGLDDIIEGLKKRMRDINSSKLLNLERIVEEVENAKRIYNITSLQNLWKDPTTISKFVSFKGNYKAGIKPNNYSDVFAIMDYLEDVLDNERKKLKRKSDYRINVNRQISNLYIKKLKEALSDRYNSQRDDNMIDYISNRKCLHRNDVDEFVNSFPSYLSSFISNRFSSSQISDFVQCSDFRTYSKKSLKTKKERNYPSIESFKGLLLGHSLSPLPDSISLLMELGKYKRIESFYSLPATIICAAPEWSIYNEIVSLLEDVGFSKLDIERGFDKNIKYRKKIYSFLGFQKNKSLEFLTINSVTESKSIDDFDSYIKKYIFLAEEIFKFAEKINQSDNFIYVLNEFSNNDDNEYKDQLPDSLKFLEFQDYSSVIDVIKEVYESFGNINKHTFYYVFLQRLAQQDYSNYIKIGNRSEVYFDYPYSKLDLIEGYRDHKLFSFYYQHYNMPIPNESFGSIPYYNPNKKLLSIFGEDIEHALSDWVINVFDYKKEKKIQNISEEISLKDLAIQLCDLLSFSMYAFNSDEDDYYWDSVDEIAKELSLEFAEVILENRENGDKHLLANFGKLVLYLENESAQLPYYYYPFAFIIAIEEDFEENLEAKVRDFYKQFIIKTLEHLNKRIPFPSWTLKSK